MPCNQLLLLCRSFSRMMALTNFARGKMRCLVEIGSISTIFSVLDI